LIDLFGAPILEKVKLTEYSSFTYIFSGYRHSYSWTRWISPQWRLAISEDCLPTIGEPNAWSSYSR